MRSLVQHNQQFYKFIRDGVPVSCATPAARLATTMPAFHHNAFLVVSNGDRAKYGSITSKWDHFAEWKRKDEKEKGDLEQPRSGPCR